MTKLVDATPSAAFDIGRGEWIFQIGETVVGRDVGVVYLLQLSPKYVRFKVIEQYGEPAFQAVSERLLTEDEQERFAALAHEVETAGNPRETTGLF